MSQIKCDVLGMDSVERNLVVLRADQELFLKPHSVIFVRCQNIGFKFEGFHVFLSHYDEGIGLFLPDQSYENGQDSYILTICNYGLVV